MSLLILFIVLSIGFSFLCSVLEAVLLSVNAAYIEILEEKSPKAGKLFKKLKLDIDKSIASILILNTIAHTLGAAGVGAQAAKLYGNDVVFYVSAILTLLILIFSEIIPKTIGTVYWKQLAPFTAYTINVLIYVTYPLIVITQFLTKKISKDGLHMNTMSKEELIATTLLGEDQGIIDEQESDMIENVLRLDDIKLQSILTPRSVVFGLQEDMSISKALEESDITKFSRIPVYSENIDQITGVVHTRKILKMALDNKKDTILKDIKSDLFAINEKIPVSYAMDMFIKRKEHMFLVQDNYGQTEGIVTLEDCVETVLGVEIMDEFDTTEDMQKLAKLQMKKKRQESQK